MKLLKSLFLSRLLREKVLVFVFVLLGALIWLSSASDALSEKRKAFSSAGSELRTQALWLGNQVAIEGAAEAAVRNLDPSKTYDATFLVAEITSMARRSGLAVNTEPPRTQRSPQFAVHTVQVTTRRAELTALLRFYQDLASKAPYLGLERISVQGDRTAPGMLNVTLQVASVELQRSAGMAVAPRAVTPASEPAAPIAPSATEPSAPTPTNGVTPTAPASGSKSDFGPAPESAVPAVPELPLLPPARE